GLNTVGGKAGNFYFKTLNWFIGRRIIALFCALVIAGAGVFGFFMLNQELLPREDRGAIRIFLTGPDGASLAYTDEQTRKIEAVLQPYQDSGVINDIYSVVGRWDKNRAFITGTLSDWE